MKHWSPDPAAASPPEHEHPSRDAWIEWLTHAPVHGVTPDRFERDRGASFLVLALVGGFWVGAAWMLFGR